METIDTPPGIQNRNAFRTSVRPSEIKISSFWIHEPNTFFKEVPVKKGQYVLALNEGVTLLNISAGGALIRIAAPPEIGMLRLLALPPPPGENKAGQHGQTHYRDISIGMRADLRKDVREILVACRIVRAVMLRTTEKQVVYELATRFNAWGNLVGTTVQWHKLRDDGNVPPLMAWIVQRQLSNAR